MLLHRRFKLDDETVLVAKLHVRKRFWFSLNVEAR